ncbi:hypothetical protein D3C75_800450 [compost metagenome]
MIATKLDINVAVILRIVFMDARRGKDRIEIQRGDAQHLEIRQVFADTVQIAAIER